MEPNEIQNKCKEKFLAKFSTGQELLECELPEGHVESHSCRNHAWITDPKTNITQILSSIIGPKE